MNYTDNLHLLKPETTELFDVDHANSNAELIDAAVAAKASLEQVAAMLEQIVESGEITDVDIGAVTTLKEILHNTGFRIAVGTTAELQALADAGLMEDNVLYIPSDGDTGWVDLTLEGSWTVWSFDGVAQTPQCRRIGNHVYVRGAVACESISTSLGVHKTFAYLPAGFRPQRNVFRETTGSGLTVSRIETDSTGELYTRAVFDLADGTIKDTCVWMSIDMDFLID